MKYIIQGNKTEFFRFRFYLANNKVRNLSNIYFYTISSRNHYCERFRLMGVVND